MALSVGNIGAARVSTSYVSTRPQNYAVENKSQTSSAYTESVSQLDASSIGLTNPVQYPTAEIAKNTVSHIQAAQKAEQGYSSIADSFSGATTSYGIDRTAASYSSVGSVIDAFA